MEDYKTNNLKSKFVERIMIGLLEIPIEKCELKAQIIYDDLVAFEKELKKEDYDLFYQAFKEGNSKAMMPEDDWITIDIDFRTWYDIYVVKNRK